MRKTLQRIGVLALVLWTVAGFVAFGLASQRAQIIFGEAGSSEEAEVALLRDRVDVLSADLRSLAGAASDNFKALSQELEHEKAARLADQELVQTTPISEPTNSEVEPARKVSFLSFKLPSDDFSFDEERTFQVLSSLSRVGFDGTSTIHDFTGVADKVEGSFTVNPARPEDGISGELNIRAAGIASGSQGRDEAMYEHLDIENFERIRFGFDSFEATSLDEANESLKGRVYGRMKIRGVEREVMMAVQGRMDSSRRLVIEGEMPLSQADYNVPVPVTLGMISMEDEVRVWIHILARPVPRETKK